MQLPKLLGAKLKYLRRFEPEFGRLQQISEKIRMGISKHILWSIENKGMIPPPKVILELSRLFVVPIDYFIDDNISIYEYRSSIKQRQKDIDDPAWRIREKLFSQRLKEMEVWLNHDISVEYPDI